MNTAEINKVLMRSPVTQRSYLGCFAADQIPEIRDTGYPCSMVVNTDPSSSFGSHWIAIYVPSAEQVEYYDSLGVWPADSPHIRAFLAQFPKCKYNREQWQSNRSSACGRHAIYFLHRRCAGRTFDQVMHHFKKCKQNADRIVCAYVRTHIFNTSNDVINGQEVDEI